jgi:hypothetical protein
MTADTAIRRKVSILSSDNASFVIGSTRRREGENALFESGTWTTWNSSLRVSSQIN